MGILNLTKFLADVAPQCIKETDIKSYFGKCLLRRAPPLLANAFT